MKASLALFVLIALSGCAASEAPQPPTAALEALVGQTCVAHAYNGNELRYTIRHQDGKWAVHDVFGPAEPYFTDGGWRPGTVDGSTISFPGVTINTIRMTATGPHTARSAAGSVSNSFTCS